MVYKSGKKVYRVLANLVQPQLEELDRMVKSGSYHSRSEAIREAITLLIELKKGEELKEKLK